MASRKRPPDWTVMERDLVAQFYPDQGLVARVPIPRLEHLSWWTDAELTAGIAAHEAADGRIEAVRTEAIERLGAWQYRTIRDMRRQLRRERALLLRERTRRDTRGEREAESATWQRMQAERLLRLRDVVQQRLVPPDFPFAELPLRVSGGGGLRVERVIAECRWPERSVDVVDLDAAGPYTEIGVPLRFILRTDGGRYFSRGTDQVFVDRSVLAQRVLAHVTGIRG